MDYVRIYEDAGNRRDLNGGYHIPLFTCAHSYGESYARSVSYGISKIFSLGAKTRKSASEDVYSYLVAVCAEEAAKEDCRIIYNTIISGLASKSISVFALSYKHRMRGGRLGPRQRLPSEMMKAMAAEIVSHATESGSLMFCFWLDQILGQRQPYAERKWVDNGLLPYAVFDTIVFDFFVADIGAWLTVEKLLCSGRSNCQKRQHSSTLIRRDVKEGGPDSLMRGASAIACGVIDQLRGDFYDKQSILSWSLETLDISQIRQHANHFSRPLGFATPWNKSRLSSIMVNLDVLPGELSRVGQLGRPTCWKQEAELLSSFIPQELRALCDGSWLSRGVTRIYATGLSNRYLFVQYIKREMRPPLVIAATVTESANTKTNRVENYMATSFDTFLDPQARHLEQRGRDLIEWKPLDQFRKCNNLISAMFIEEFYGKWLCGSQQ